MEPLPLADENASVMSGPEGTEDAANKDDEVDFKRLKQLLEIVINHLTSDFRGNFSIRGYNIPNDSRHKNLQIVVELNDLLHKVVAIDERKQQAQEVPTAKKGKRAGKMTNAQQAELVATKQENKALKEELLAEKKRAWEVEWQLKEDIKPLAEAQKELENRERAFSAEKRTLNEKAEHWSDSSLKAFRENTQLREKVEDLERKLRGCKKESKESLEKADAEAQREQLTLSEKLHNAETDAESWKTAYQGACDRNAELSEQVKDLKRQKGGNNRLSMRIEALETDMQLLTNVIEHSDDYKHHPENLIQSLGVDSDSEEYGEEADDTSISGPGLFAWPKNENHHPPHPRDRPASQSLARWLQTELYEQVTQYNRPEYYQQDIHHKLLGLTYLLYFYEGDGVICAKKEYQGREPGVYAVEGSPELYSVTLERANELYDMLVEGDMVIVWSDKSCQTYFAK